MHISEIHAVTCFVSCSLLIISAEYCYSADSGLGERVTGDGAEANILDSMGKFFWTVSLVYNAD